MTMAINGLGGTSPFDQQTFGAAVASETLDIMNNSGRNQAPVDQETAEASLVSQTLDYMNPRSSSGDTAGMGQSYNFQTDVLSAHAMGSVINTMI